MERADYLRFTAPVKLNYCRAASEGNVGCAAQTRWLKTVVPRMPYAKILLAVALAALACLALVILLKSRRRAGPMLAPQSGLPPLKGSLDANARGRRVDVARGREILEMLETGRRAEAVALVRERTGWGALEADAAVVKLENLRKRLES